MLGTGRPDRAFKLDELKPNIQWWEAGAQPPQFLVAGDVVMSTAQRPHRRRAEGRQKPEGRGTAASDLDYWAIRRPPNKALAEQYIATLTPKPQQGYAQHIAYGPTNIAGSSLDAKTLANLPNSPANGKTRCWKTSASGPTTATARAAFAAWATK